MKCPLCKETNIYLYENINTEDIITLYKINLKADIVREFGNIHELGFYGCSNCNLKFFYPAVTGSEGFYEQLHCLPWYFLEEKDEYKFALKYIKDNARVLEIGCGKGAFANFIRTENYIGLEFSQRALQMAADTGIDVYNESIEEYASKNPERHDVVCLFQVLEHVSDSYNFLKCAINCINTGGLLIISVPSADSFVSSVVNNALNMPPHHATWWTDRSLEAIASIFNLDILASHHENLAEIHFQWYSSSLILNSLNRLLMRPHKLVDVNRKTRILSKLSTFIGKHCENYLVRKSDLPRGHSVTVIYRKSN